MSPTNFIAEYDHTDTDADSSSTYETDHNFQLSGYGTSPASVQHSWVIVMPTPQHTSSGAVTFTQIKATDHLPPPGYSFQVGLPPAAALAMRAASGSSLVGRKFLQKWPEYGWCLGEITRQNVSGAAGVNFFATYEDYPEFEEASQSFRLAEYGSGGDAEDYSWVLLEPVAPLSVGHEHLNPEFRKLLYDKIKSLELDRQAPHPLIRCLIWYMDNCTGAHTHPVLAVAYTVAAASHHAYHTHSCCFLSSYVPHT